MESHRIIELFTEIDIGNPMQVIRGFLAQIGAGIDDDAICFHSVNPGVVRDYAGEKLSNSIGFFVARANKIAASKNIDIDSLDLEGMRLSEFTIPENDCRCIMMAVPGLD